MTQAALLVTGGVAAVHAMALSAKIGNVIAITPRLTSPEAILREFLIKVDIKNKNSKDTLLLGYTFK